MNATEALFSGYPRRLWSDKLVVVIQAYADDSASEIGPKDFFLCAYLHNAEVWARFSNDWDMALKENPKIDYLHMVDAWSKEGEFRGWDEAVRNKKLIRLAKVIGHYKPIALEVSVSRGAFNKFIKPVVPYFMQTPYFCCFYGLVITAARFHKMANVPMPVDFIFDETNSGPNALMFYDYVKSHQTELGPLFGCTPIFRDDKKVMPLQAADMLAWHVRRESESRAEHLPAMPYLRTTVAQIKLDDEVLKNLGAKLSAETAGKNMTTKGSWRRLKPAVLGAISARQWPVEKPTLLSRIRAWFAKFGRG